MHPALGDLIETVNDIQAARYPGAKVIFLAGSLIRGDGTSTSDLDLVVVYEELDAAYRESFRHQRWPIEAFVHDPATLEYFFRSVDRPSGVPSLPNMVAEGIEIPEPSEFSKKLKGLAKEVIDQGPPPWSHEDRDHSRYVITDLVEDLKAPRSRQEAIATLLSLYSALANHYFRSKGLWSSKGKTIPRSLIAHDTDFARRFLSAFDAALTSQQTDHVIELASDLLSPDGGYLFDGYTRLAPEEWRHEVSS